MMQFDQLGQPSSAAAHAWPRGHLAHLRASVLHDRKNSTLQQTTLITNKSTKGWLRTQILAVAFGQQREGAASKRRAELVAHSPLSKMRKAKKTKCEWRCNRIIEAIFLNQERRSENLTGQSRQCCSKANFRPWVNVRNEQFRAAKRSNICCSGLIIIKNAGHSNEAHRGPRCNLCASFMRTSLRR